VYLALGKSAEICVAIKKLAKSGKSGTSGVGRIFLFVIALLIRVLPRSRAPISLQENGSLGVPPHPMGL